MTRIDLEKVVGQLLSEKLVSLTHFLAHLPHRPCQDCHVLFEIQCNATPTISCVRLSFPFVKDNHQSKKDSVNRSKVVKIRGIVHLLVKIDVKRNLKYWSTWENEKLKVSKWNVFTKHDNVDRKSFKPCGSLCCIGLSYSSPESGQTWSLNFNLYMLIKKRRKNFVFFSSFETPSS